MKGYVRKIIPFSSVDGPGNRVGIFLQGCNFNCLYCHNPETIEVYSENKEDQIKDEEVNLLETSEVIDKIRGYFDFVSGVTISGGECTVQFEFLLKLCEELKMEGIHILIDSNGYLGKEKLEKLSKVVDGFMIDVKSFDEEEHIKLTGKSNKLVIENVEYLLSVDKVFELRTVIIPDFLDNVRNVKEISNLICKYNSDVRYKLIKYRNNGVISVIKHLESPTNKDMGILYKIAHEAGCKDIILL